MRRGEGSAELPKGDSNPQRTSALNDTVDWLGVEELHSMARTAVCPVASSGNELHGTIRVVK